PALYLFRRLRCRLAHRLSQFLQLQRLCSEPNGTRGTDEFGLCEFHHSSDDQRRRHRKRYAWLAKYDWHQLRGLLLHEGSALMAGLDDLSRVIGALQEASETASRERERLFNKLEEIAERLAPLDGLVKAVQAHEKKLDELQAMKDRSL